MRQILNKTRLISKLTPIGNQMPAEKIKENQTPKRRGGRQKNFVRMAIEQELGIKKKQANRMLAAGVTPESVGDIASARLKKITTETNLLAEKLAILQKEHIPASKVREASIAACSVFKAEVSALEINLPPLLEGLHASEMRTIISSHIQRLLKDLCERLESIG